MNRKICEQLLIYGETPKEEIWDVVGNDLNSFVNQLTSKPDHVFIEQGIAIINIMK